MKTNPYEINYIDQNGILAEMGVEIGDKLLSINNSPITDELDIYFNEQSDELFIEIEKQNGEKWNLEIEKDDDEELGIVQFDQAFGIRRCHNKCIFCFIDQMPPNMRETLYIKDDDERLSFLQGNYVTLTNLTDNLIQRIVRYRIMPINISIHTTNSELRQKMLHNKKAGDILKNLNYFAENNIIMNGQIVLCPDYNDKEELVKTLTDLTQFYPALQSVSVVPVGLSDYRDGLSPLKPVNKEKAIETFNIINEIQNQMLLKYGTHFVYCSDEMYLLAQKELPDADFYEDYAQIENGVGMMADFKDSLISALNNKKYQNNNKETKIGIITSRLAADFMAECTALISKKYPNFCFEIFPIKNVCFGSKITVSGLVCGKDIINQIDPNNEIDCFIIPENMVKYQTELFLDDITVLDVKNALNKAILISPVDGESFLNIIFSNKRGKVWENQL